VGQHHVYVIDVGVPLVETFLAGDFLEARFWVRHWVPEFAGDHVTFDKAFARPVAGLKDRRAHSICADIQIGHHHAAADIRPASTVFLHVWMIGIEVADDEFKG
jgi:hypothetical protein